MNGRGDEGIRGPAAVQRLYDSVASFYDVSTSPYELIGGRKLQHAAIDLLNLLPGDTVVDLGTGTGWNLPHLARRVGPQGRVIAVDLSQGMLNKAEQRCARLNLTVEFVQADMREFVPPPKTAAVIAGFALEMVPEYAQVIDHLACELVPGSRIATTGLREPQGWPEWVVRLGVLLTRPLGVRPAYRDISPWEAISDRLVGVTYADAMAGAIYLAVGVVPDSNGSLPR